MRRSNQGDAWTRSPEAFQLPFDVLAGEHINAMKTTINLVSTLLVAAIGILVSPCDCVAQSSRNPHLGYVYPAGGRRGEIVEVTVGGQFIRDVDDVYLSGAGVECEILEWYRPLTQGEYQDLSRRLEEAREFLSVDRGLPADSPRIKLQEVAERAMITEEQLAEMEIFRRREADPKRQPNEQLVEEVTVRLTIADDAAVGKRELRLTTESAMSNPLWIQIGRWPEVSEHEPDDDAPVSLVARSLPLTINGQISPGDVDRFEFQASRGDKLVISASVRELIPYLADAVPGWFQCVLSLTDASGREVAYADSFHYRQDPVLYFDVPEDGLYTLAVHDSIYRGREDFVYRITLGELPFVTGVYPLGGRMREDVTVELEGWNLTQQAVTLHPARSIPGVVQYFEVPQPGFDPIEIPLYVDQLLEHFDEEPNDTRDTAQQVADLAVINGRIDRPGDVDVYKLDGRGRLAFNVTARKAGSPLDSTLTLLDSEGREIAFNDDHTDRSQALETHHADSHLEVRLPDDGSYYLVVADAQHKGGREFVYRMTMTVPRPDFELRVVPSSVIARPGTVTPITLFALRRDGFQDEILVSLVNPPRGVRLDGNVVPANVDQVSMTLTLPPDALPGTLLLEMEGQSTSPSGRTTHPVIPAERMMQAFIWYHLVPAEDWTVVVSGQISALPPIEFPTLQTGRPGAPPRVRLQAGRTIILPARLLQEGFPTDELRLELHEPPPGITVQGIEVQNDVVQIGLHVAEETTLSGHSGNLIFLAFREYLPQPTEDNTSPEPQRYFIGHLPAIPFEVEADRR